MWSHPWYDSFITTVLSSPVPSKREQRKLKTSNFLKKGVLLNLSSSKFMNLSFETIAGGGGEKRIIQKTRSGLGDNRFPQRSIPPWAMRKLTHGNRASISKIWFQSSPIPALFYNPFYPIRFINRYRVLRFTINRRSNGNWRPPPFPD